MNEYEQNYKHLQELLREKDHVRLEVEGYMPLVVETIDGSLISACHYGEMNGDPMRDPEVVFLVDGDRAKPVYYRNDYVGMEHATVREYFGDVQVNPQLQNGLDSFVHGWWKNLQEQGFFKAANQEIREDLVQDIQAGLQGCSGVNSPSVFDMVSPTKSNEAAKDNRPSEVAEAQSDEEQTIKPPRQHER